MAFPKSIFNIQKGDEFVPVLGWQLSPHLSCRQEKGHGYRITHLPSGWLITDMGFDTVEAAGLFAEKYEAAFGSYLDRSDPRIQQDASRADPSCKPLYDLVIKLNKLSKTSPVISEEYLKIIMGDLNGH